MSNTPFKYNYAITLRIPESICKRAQNVDYKRACEQMNGFVEALRCCSMNVFEIPADNNFPESVFVEDNAVVINGTALICRHPTRMGEVPVIRQTLSRELNLRVVECDKDNAKLSGGDVLFTGSEIFVGVNQNTNELGAQIVAKTFPEYPTMIIRVNKQSESLKSFVSVAGEDVLLFGSSQAARQAASDMGQLSTKKYYMVQTKEDLAANCLYANGTLFHLNQSLVPQSYPILVNKFGSRYQNGLDLSELVKVKGGVSRLAILIGKFKTKNIPHLNDNAANYLTM